MNNKVKILTAVVGVIVVGLGVGVTLLQPKTNDIQEPIVSIMVEETIEEIVTIEEIETEEVEPTPEEIGEPDTIEVVEPTTVIEPTPVVVAEPEPTPVVVAEPEPTPVAVAEPEPTPVAVVEPEPTPVAVVEPEPTPVAVVEPEPTPVAVAEPEPVVAESVASVSSGQTYTTVYNGVEYTVTQEQMDMAWIDGMGFRTTDGIPALVFSQIKNAGVTAGGMDLTSEEFAA